MTVRRALAAIVLLGLAACGSGSTTLGPLTFQAPKGWLVSDRAADSIKVTNGTTASDTSTQPGTATAVFDIYLDAPQTPEELTAVLRKNNAVPHTEHLIVGGYQAVIVSYATSYFGPSSDVLFVPAWRVEAIYRAALPDDNAAYVNNRRAFRAAIGTISFSGRPAGPA